MKLEQADAVWLDARHEFSFAELAQCSRLSEAELRELVDYGALVPTNPQEAEWTFGGDIVVTMQAAGRLRDDRGAQRLGARLGFLPGHLLQRAGEHDRLAGNRRAFDLSGGERSDLHFLQQILDHFRVVGFVEEILDRLRQRAVGLE